MPVGKLYLNGLTMGAGGNANPVGGKRGKVDGWSMSAVRRHTRWLYSVDTKSLTGEGWSLSLTLRDCPPDDVAWTRLRKEWLDQVRASGLLVRGHWVVEWQERKVPHLHLAVYLREGTRDVDALLVGTWLRLGAKYGAGPKGQHLAPITGVLGWLEYLSKHASRGVGHYQRQGKPPGWEKTGRLWGHFGDWSNAEPVGVRLTRREFFRFRRLVRSWRVADARQQLREARNLVEVVAARRRIRFARRMLACNDRALSEVRGVSEWIPEHLGMVLLLLAAGDAEGAREAAQAAPRRALRPPARQGLTVEHF